MNTGSVRCHLRLPPAPTTALPGSPEKVRVLAERARLGVSLWHPLDANLPASGSLECVRVAPISLAS